MLEPTPTQSSSEGMVLCASSALTSVDGSSSGPSFIEVEPNKSIVQSPLADLIRENGAKSSGALPNLESDALPCAQITS